MIWSEGLTSAPEIAAGFCSAVVALMNCISMRFVVIAMGSLLLLDEFH